MNRWLKALAILALVAVPLAAQKKRPLSPADIDDIATLLKLEDTRTFDADALARIVKSSHPEVRRRAVMSMGRIVNNKEKALPMLAALRDDKDPEIVATVAWASGQQKDPGAVAWLGKLLNTPSTPVAIGKEAAQALGKIRGAEAKTALATYLGAASLKASPVVVGEALLARGRFPTKDGDAPNVPWTEADIAPIARWMKSADPQIRWRAAWALFRPRDPLATPYEMTLSTDANPEVRFWAMRGLTAPVVSQSKVPMADAALRLRQALSDPDRRVRTEALTALGSFDAAAKIGYDDDASVTAVANALDSPDNWLAVAAARAMTRHTERAASLGPRVLAAVAPGKPLSLRTEVMPAVVALAGDRARAIAEAMAAEDNATAKAAASAAIRQLDAAAARAAGTPPAGRTGGAGGRGNAQPPALTPRPDAEYRALVTRYIVPAYDGIPAPHVIFETPRGPVEIEVNTADAPFGAEYLFDVIAKGDIAGTEFGRVEPNFVAQENAIRPSGRLRDEVNRRGLLRGTLAWASAGLDTGRPGYTLGNIPQPHNEGDFTNLGRIVKGLDAVDHLERGDKITGARVVK
jgi:cyclophilin family peptidyl-prolyl cis-trans isomerase/HEAT repeat protein